MRKILYPTDFSPCARQAFAHAASLARRFGAELHALHVVTLRGQDPYDPTFYLPAADEAYAEAARAVARELATLALDPLAAGLSVVASQRRDVLPGPAILDYAGEHQIDLVVMGTHGRRHVSRLLLGSVTEEVVRRSHCPVLTLRAADAGRRERLPMPRRLLVPFDFSSPARAALADAADIARHYGAHLAVLHVIEEPQWPSVYGCRGFAELAQQRERIVLEVERRLRAVTEGLAPGVPCDLDVQVGRPATEILACASRPEIDLVVMSSRGLTGVKRLLFGSTAEEVVRLADTPVLVVKPQGAAAPRPAPIAELAETRR
jgi:nucleotide-binding universal stress UspA family protein